MKLTYTVYKVGEEPTKHALIVPEAFEFSSVRRKVQEIIGATEPIEHVNILGPDGNARDMFVSELGHVRLSTREPFPRNEAATTLYRAASLARLPGQDPERLPWIAGTAVVFDQKVWR